MKRAILLMVFLVAVAGCKGPGEKQLAAEDTNLVYAEHFTDSTLRLDYVFCGDAHHQAIYLQGMVKTGRWAGRRHNLAKPLLRGNGQVLVKNPATEAVLYANSFSTLFQEWQGYEEAQHTQKAFENCLLVPFPKDTVLVQVLLSDNHGKVSSTMSHRVVPGDILIRQARDGGNECRTLWEGGTLESAIDILILSEGYTSEQQDKFFADAARGRDALLRHPPFSDQAGNFTIRSLFVPSQDAGPSIPRLGQWHNTVAGSHFDTFYTDRYLTTSSMQKVHDAIGTVPFEHLIVLVNTPEYGGGGIFNSVTIMGSDHFTFDQVLVHEFGHAFGGLGDEYFYGDFADPPYPADTEPWEPNITTLVDFSSKWQDMLPQGTPIPTPVDSLEMQDVRSIWHQLSPEQKEALNFKLGVYEGAGYQTHGVYRPVQECRMKINECEHFCPVCTRAIERMIDYYTTE